MVKTTEKVSKPESVASVPEMSEAWDAVTSGYTFRACDVPQLTMLCQWYAVASECMRNIGKDGKVRVMYAVDGEPHMVPYLHALQFAQAEIAALNKQLGINPGAKTIRQAEVTALNVIQGERKNRKPKPASAHIA